MSNPTYNKWKSTTIYGELKVRDLTNSTGTSVVETAYTDISGNVFLRNNLDVSGNATFTNAITCNGTITNSTDLTTKSFTDANYLIITDASNNYVKISGNNTITGNNTFSNAITCNGTITNSTDLATKSYVDSAVSGGGGSSILGINNNWTGTNTYNSYLPTSTQTPTNSNDLTTKTYVDSGISGLSSVYQTISGMSSYLTTATASSTYQTISGMSSYLTTSTASSTYQTIADMTNYLTTSTASSTYQTISGMSSYFSLAGNNTASGNNTFSNAITCNGTITNSNHLTTKSYVDGLSGASLTANNIFTGINQFSKVLYTNNSFIGGDNSTLTLTAPTNYSFSCNSASYSRPINSGTSTTNISQILIDTFTLPVNHIKPIFIYTPVAFGYSSNITTGQASQTINADFTISNYYYDIYINGTLYESVVALEEVVRPKTSNSVFTISTIVSNTQQTSNIFLTTFYLNYQFPKITTSITMKVVFRIQLDASIAKQTADGGTYSGSITPTLYLNNTTIFFPTSTPTTTPNIVPSISPIALTEISPGTTQLTILFYSILPSYWYDGGKVMYYVSSVRYEYTIYTKRINGTTTELYVNNNSIPATISVNTNVYISTYKAPVYKFTTPTISDNISYLPSINFNYLIPNYITAPTNVNQLGYIFQSTSTNWTTPYTGRIADPLCVVKTPSNMNSAFALWFVDINIPISMTGLNVNNNQLYYQIRYFDENFVWVNYVNYFYIYQTTATLNPYNFTHSLVARMRENSPFTFSLFLTNTGNTCSFTFNYASYSPPSNQPPFIRFTRIA